MPFTYALIDSLGKIDVLGLIDIHIISHADIGILHIQAKAIRVTRVITINIILVMQMLLIERVVVLEVISLSRLTTLHIESRYQSSR